MPNASETASLSQRQSLTSAGVTAAGLTLLNHAVAQENVPGAEVANRSSSIRISAVKSYWVGPILYVKIETNHGISGWEVVKGVDPQFVQSLVASLAELIVGENPTRIEHLCQKLFRAHRDMRGGPFMVHSIAGLDIALWDIAGKL